MQRNTIIDSVCAFGSSRRVDGRREKTHRLTRFAGSHLSVRERMKPGVIPVPARHAVIPTRIDRDTSAHSRRPMERLRAASVRLPPSPIEAGARSRRTRLASPPDRAGRRKSTPLTSPRSGIAATMETPPVYEGDPRRDRRGSPRHESGTMRAGRRRKMDVGRIARRAAVHPNAEKSGRSSRGPQVRASPASHAGT